MKAEYLIIRRERVDVRTFSFRILSKLQQHCIELSSGESDRTNMLYKNILGIVNREIIRRWKAAI